MAEVLTADRVAYRYRADAVGSDRPDAGRPNRTQQGLDPISLRVDAGDAVLLAGPSGCGKSTLARCLTGLIPHLYRGSLSGQVRLCDLDTQTTPLWQLAECAGFVFQNAAAQMVGSSVQDEILFGLETLGLERGEMRARLDEALARYGLRAFAGRSPLTLSGGEQQRLALAAILARRPPVLVLDEPFSMQDSTAAADLVGHLGEIAAAGTAVVICEHRSEPLRALPGLRSVQVAAQCALEDGAELAPEVALPRAPSFSLTVRDLGVTLGGRPVFADLDFEVPGGQIVAIVGRNGVGKTTLLRALTGLQPAEGTVLVEGRKPDLVMVFQNPDLQLFNPTVREEILYHLPDPDLAWYAWLLQMLGLVAYETTPPLLLSEGEKKRVALATALMRAPRHGLLLDEPSLGQDTAHKARLMRLARALADSGRFVIMTTHDLTLATQADRMLLMGDSGFVADGPSSAVLKDAAAWSRARLRVPAWVSDAVGGAI